MHLLLTLILAAPFYADKTDLLQVQHDSGEVTRIETQEDWLLRRGHILENMQEAMGAIKELPTNDLDVHYLESTRFDTYTRHKITFAPEAGDRLPAYLLIPHTITKPVPGVVCLHPTSSFGKGMVVGLGNRPNRNYATELAERGYVTLAPDYPTFGDYDIDVYAKGYVSAIAKGILNHRRCLDVLSALPQVNAEQLATIGHSMGGHNSLYLAVFEPRIKAVVTSCGFNAFPKYKGGDLTGWSHKGYMPRIKERYNCDPAKIPFDFTEVLAAIAPRPVFISAPLHDANFEVTGVEDCVNAAQPVYTLFGSPDNLHMINPDCEHDFPEAAREQAYQFLDTVLDHTPQGASD